MIVPLAALGALIGALPLILSRSMRSDALSIVIVAAALFAPAIPTFRIADALRMQGFRLAATCAEPLIVAIEKYVDAKGTPPDTLQQLVPGYIPAIPTRLPPIQVVSSPDAPRLYEGNAWILSASVVRGFVSFDLFLYFPNQRYPERGYGGSLERIGSWAYVHE